MGDKRRKGQRFLVRLAVVGGLVIVGVIAFNQVQERSLGAKIAKARAAGFPFDAKDMVPRNLPKPAENAALYYAALEPYERSLVLTDRQKGKEALSKEEPTQGERQALETYLREVDSVIESFVQASRLPRCYFEKKWERGVDVLLPEYSQLKHASRLAVARGVARIAEGDERGLDDIAAAMRAARHMRMQPPFIALLASLAVDAIALAGVQDALVLVERDAEALAVLKGIVESAPEEFDLTNLLRCEAFFSWWCAENLGYFTQYMNDFSVDLHISVGSKSQTVSRGLKSDILDLYVPALTSYKPGDDERALFESLESRSAVMRERLLTGTFFSAVVPYFENADEALNRARARRRCNLAAIAVIEHRNKLGQWPKTLAEAGTALTDPFDQTPLKYRRDGKGFRVWSVGVDKVDHGGATKDESRDDDEVVVFPG